jgi:D-serine deaminase-like pyridoxal phosphate-dependent protein
LSAEAGVEAGFGLVVEAPGASVERLNEEHGYVVLDGDELQLGQQVRIVPNHVCVAVHLYEELVGVRDGRVELRWPVARGR